MTFLTLPFAPNPERYTFVSSDLQLAIDAPLPDYCARQGRRYFHLTDGLTWARDISIPHPSKSRKSVASQSRPSESSPNQQHPLWSHSGTVPDLASSAPSDEKLYAVRTRYLSILNHNSRFNCGLQTGPGKSLDACARGSSGGINRPAVAPGLQCTSFADVLFRPCQIFCVTLVVWTASCVRTTTTITLHEAVRLLLRRPRRPWPRFILSWPHPTAFSIPST